MVHGLEGALPSRPSRQRRKEKVDEFRRKACCAKASTAIERSRSIAVLELEPTEIVEELARVRVIDKETREEIMRYDTREGKVEALVDYLADQPASRVLRPYANALKSRNRFLYALLDIDKCNPYTAHITEVNLNKVSSLTDMPVAEEQAEDLELYSRTDRRGSLPAMHFGNLTFK